MDEKHLQAVEVHAGRAGEIRVVIRGEVDLSRFDELDSILDAAQADCATRVEVDLSSVSFMDSQGLRLLILAHQRAAENGHQLLLLDPSPAVRRLFDVAGMGHVFEVAGDQRRADPCPCCAGSLESGDAVGDGLRPGDGWCPECRWIVMAEVLAGDWPVECPTHVQPISRTLPGPS